MKNQKQTIDNLMNAMFGYMRSIHRSEGTIKRYRRRWHRVKDFMLENKIRYYDTNVEKVYLTSLLGDFDYNQLDLKEKELVNVIEALSEFQKTGRIIMGPRKHSPRVFKGDTGRIITDFVDHRRKSLQLSQNTIQAYIIYLYPFYRYMNSIGVKHIGDLKASDILSYIEQMDPHASAKKHVSLNKLRIFF